VGSGVSTYSCGMGCVPISGVEAVLGHDCLLLLSVSVDVSFEGEHERCSSAGVEGCTQTTFVIPYAFSKSKIDVVTSAQETCIHAELPLW
jgi:hypothetical protein